MAKLKLEIKTGPKSPALCGNILMAFMYFPLKDLFDLIRNGIVSGKSLMKQAKMQVLESRLTIHIFYQKLRQKLFKRKRAFKALEKELRRWRKISELE